MRQRAGATGSGHHLPLGQTGSSRPASERSGMQGAVLGARGQPEPERPCSGHRAHRTGSSPHPRARACGSLGLLSDSKINPQAGREVNQVSPATVITWGRELPADARCRETPASRHGELRGGGREEAGKEGEPARARNKGSPGVGSRRAHCECVSSVLPKGGLDGEKPTQDSGCEGTGMQGNGRT